MNLSNCKAITFFDVETSHLDPHIGEILSIAIITDWDEGGTDSTYYKIKPTRIETASPEALKICGYSEEEWEDAVEFADVAKRIARKLQWGPVVAHNAQFDVSHITEQFKREGYQTETWEKPNYFRVGYPVIDTIALTYLYLDTDKQNLHEVRKHLGIDTERGHNALTDVEDTRTLFYHIISQTTGA